MKLAFQISEVRLLRKQGRGKFSRVREVTMQAVYDPDPAAGSSREGRIVVEVADGPEAEALQPGVVCQVEITPQGEPPDDMEGGHRFSHHAYRWPRHPQGPGPGVFTAVPPSPPDPDPLCVCEHRESYHSADGGACCADRYATGERCPCERFRTQAAE